jgi:hypothetical protein
MARHCWSVDAELHNGAHAKTYRHDPYRVRGKVFYFDDADASAAAPSSQMPEGTRHVSLWGRVSFVPYPSTEFHAPAPKYDDHDLVRVFIGQLPYFVTDMQLSWLCHTFGGGSVVMYPERIMKRQPSGERLPTGCIHAYATPEMVEAMAAGMHKRMLVDDTGVWLARSREEMFALNDYIGTMKVNRNARVPNRPYDTVVIQLATSTYIPRHVADKPHLAEKAISAVADVVSRPNLPSSRQQPSTYYPTTSSGHGYHADPAASQVARRRF